MKRQMIMLSDLNCPSCAAKLEKAARSLPGMEHAAVSFGTGALTVQYDETQLAESRIKVLVESMGLGIAAVVGR